MADTGYGFDGLLESIKRNREQPSIEEEELENNQCPYDAWPLGVNDDGAKSCPVCGRIYSGK